MPRVLNRRTMGESPQGSAVYVGRPSKWGNPFIEGRDGTREQVVDMYGDWLANSPESPWDDLEELRDKDLICWCAPLPCHADVLLRAANR